MAAPKGNQNAKGNQGGGRPTKYRAEYGRVAKQILAIGGTDADLALALRVSHSTLWRWRAKHPAFMDAFKEGFELSLKRVEASYYQRAVGYEHQGEKIVVIDGSIHRVPIMVHVPADTRAGEFILRNRDPDRWKDAKALEHKIPEDDPLLVFLRRINGKVMRPVEHDPKLIEGGYQDVTAERQGAKVDHRDDAPPPRPIADE